MSRLGDFFLALTIVIAGCTHGDLCNTEHPCSGSDTCVSGVCEGSSVTGGSKKIPLNTCIQTPYGYGYCTVSCDYDTGVCPNNFYGHELNCAQTGTTQASACYEDDDGAANPNRCNTDADCAGTYAKEN